MNGPTARGRGALAGGFVALAQWRLILLLWATVALLSLSAAFALWPALSSTFGGTLQGDHILRNHPVFAPEDVFEFLFEKREALRGVELAMLGSGLLGLLLQAFFAGGFVERLGRAERVSVGAFLASGWRNLWHNLKCFALFGLAAMITLGIWLGATGAASKKIFEDAPPNSGAAFAVRIGVLLVAALFWAFLSLVADVARIARRQSPDIGAWRAWRSARRTLSGSWGRALGLFVFWLLLGGAAVLLLVSLEWSTPAVSAAAIALHTLLQAAVIAVRCAARVGAWGSYVTLSDRIADSRAPKAAPLPIAAEVPAPPPEPFAEPFPAEPVS